MREMSQRDKMILLIITIIVVLGVGFFALIKPKYDSYVADSATRDQTKVEYDGVNQTIAENDPLSKQIQDNYTDAKKVADEFDNSAFAPINKDYDDTNYNYQLDQHLQQTIDSCELHVTEIEFSGAESKTLDYYYYTPNVTTYSLLEAADVNGTYAKEITDVMNESSVIGAKETAEVVGSTVTLTVTGDKEGLTNFLNAIKDDKDAVLVTSVSVENYTFKVEQEQQVQQPAEPQTDEEGNPIEPTPTTTTTTTLEDGTSSMTFTIEYYNAKPIEKPITD